MPIVAINLSDAALASSVNGASPVSAGPGLLPTFDVNNYWNPSTRQRKLVGQAAGVGGDRHSIQTASGGDLIKVDRNGTQIHDNSLNPTDQLIQFWSDDPYSCHYGFGIGSSPSYGPGPQKNVVFGWGYNYAEGGPKDPSQPSCSYRIESNYYQGGAPRFEVHVGSVIYPGGPEIRPITIAILKDGSNKADVAMGASTVYFNAENHSNQLAKLYRTDGGLTRFFLCDSTGDPGFSLETVETGTQRDTMTIGRAISAQFASVVLNSTSSTAFTFNSGANSGFLRLFGNIFQWSGATGGSMVVNTNTLSLTNQAVTRFIIRGSDTGSATAIGFLGAAPSTRVTMGAATAAASYGAAEQAMLQKAYDALRTFGFGT
ncbi:hypothetical protein V5E97_10210 [Singulisphaera sp. Ch08]|uniref:Uncharacterized protein n=1 Tax=Singulisphaera sp. Ch08 TaxID=3120278 RepID=A0AAU7CMQ0_9BACT